MQSRVLAPPWGVKRFDSMQQKHYLPDAGHIVWLQFNPQAGHEQAGHRPALVLSPATYNKRTGLMLCCPMTTQLKGYPFEVKVSGADASAVLADQVKSLDWRARHARFKEAVTAAELAEIRHKAIALVAG